MTAASHQRCDLRAAAIACAITDARAAWPAIEVSVDAFFAYLAERLPAADDPAAALGALHVADLYLACGCAHGDAAAIAAFDVHCLSVVDRALAKLGLDAATIDEVKQRLRRSLLVPEPGAPRIVGFAGRGALRSWVRVLAVHEAWAMLRTVRGHAEAEDRLVDLASAGASPELEYLKRMYRQDFERAFRAAIQALSARERTLLRQHFLDGVGINELAAVYRVHRATIGRWLENAREAVLGSTRRNLMESLDVPRAEIESILRLVLSQVELNLRPLLAHRGA
jgi:RNA polymerase sigma-70 factor (ECF subfamily)